MTGKEVAGTQINRFVTARYMASLGLGVSTRLQSQSPNEWIVSNRSSQPASDKSIQTTRQTSKKKSLGIDGISL